MGMGGQPHAPAALLPVKIRYPLYSMLGGYQSRYGQVRKISPPTGFDPRTVQPVASRYTDWAIPVPIFSIKKIITKQVWEFVPAIVFCENDEILRHWNGFTEKGGVRKQKEGV